MGGFKMRGIVTVPLQTAWYVQFCFCFSVYMYLTNCLLIVAQIRRKWTNLEAQ